MKDNSLPPKLAWRFFRWFCHPQLVDHIEGDLLEGYTRRVREVGKKKADREFTWDVFKLFRPGIIRPMEGYRSLNTYGMYKSYFKIGWRNLVRSKGYSLINIGGLAIGMMVAMLNGLWVWDELSFDRHFTNYDRVAYVAETGKNSDRGGMWIGTTMTYPLATALMGDYRDAFSEISRSTSFRERIVANGEVAITSTGLYVDPSAPEIFSLRMIAGTRGGLSQANSIMISQSLAESLFGSRDPLNQVLKLNNKSDVMVTGVYEDFPRNTELHTIRYLTTWNLYLAENKWIEQRALTDWRNHFLKIYVLIPDGRSFEEVVQKIKPALQFDPEDEEVAVKRREQSLTLYPMRDWHLRPPYTEASQLEPLVMIKLVGAIGAFVLALACINFINLSTARAERRAKEIGVRKTIGSIRSQLVSQFLAESLLVVSAAFVLAMGLTVLTLPGFNLIASKAIQMPWGNLWFWTAGAALVVLTSLVAGFYPAVYLSSFNPVKALKGHLRMGRLASIPRKALVVFQFSISVILIIGTVVVYNQIQFAKDRPVGYDRKGLIMMPKRTEAFNGKYQVLRNELKGTGVVYEVSESMGPMTDVFSGNGGWDWKDRDPSWDKSFGTLSVSHLHGKTVGWEFVQGRDFDIDNPSDSSGLVINEAALKVMKLKEPIGEPVTWSWWSDKNRVMNYKIIGVIKDPVMESPYSPTKPVVFYVKGLNGNPSWLNIRINPGVSASEALPKIEAAIKKVIPAVPFDYKFADEEYARKFGREERVGNLATVFAMLAIFISCLGLLGLVSFMAETRTKEIGIRKVLGATTTILWRMLSKDFVALVMIACLVATPIAYYLMAQWLERFEYRTDLSPWVFMITVLAAVGIALLTISYQAIKSAMMNPVNSLRSE